jgi:diguanylate cyclase (GGDEF)-like protein
VKLYGSRGAVEREFGRLKHEWALAPLRVRGLEGVHAAIALSNARLVNRLEHQAAEDPLTGLANQRAFHHACAAEFSRAQRTGAEVSIVMLDLDHYKAINDAHGHLYGDRVLLGVAEALRASSRGRDLVARMGGEEFAILLPDADTDSAYEIAERARCAIALVPVASAALSCSAGVATASPSDASPVDLLALATVRPRPWSHRGQPESREPFEPRLGRTF